MKRYKLTNFDSVLKIDGSSIPKDILNKDYQEYLSWLLEGNIPEEADIIQTIIPSVSPWQIRKALNQLNLRDTVETAISGGTQDMKDAWNYASSFDRNHPLVNSLGLLLNKTSEELDEIFILAGTL